MEHNKILFNLIKNNEFQQFKSYVENNENIDLNLRDENGNYLIIYAILKNKIDLVKILINRDSRIDIMDQEGRSLLYLPIKYGYNDIIKLLLDFDKTSIGISLVNIRDKYDNIPLHYSVFFKNIEAVQLLIQVDSNPNTVDTVGNNSLHLAVYSRNIDICRLILNTDVNINSKTQAGETALHIAANFQLEEFVKILVENAIDINAQDLNNEITPLIYAINLVNRKISFFLLKNGAIPTIQDFIGNTAIHYVIIEELYDVLQFILNNQPMPNINIYNVSGKLPLHLFLEKETIDENISSILERLIKESNLNYQDIDGNTALHLLCSKKLWKKYSDVLSTKKLNIFLKNNSGKRSVDYIDVKDFDKFIKIVVESYLYILRNSNFVWSDDWENLCKKKLFIDQLNDEELGVVKKYIGKKNKNSQDLCEVIIRKKINDQLKYQNDTCTYTSFPVKINKSCININFDKKQENCNFVGITMDILIGLIYLLNKHKNSCSTLTRNFIVNNDLCKYFLNIGIKTNLKCEFLNFEIVWIYKKLFFSDNFVLNFKKCIENPQIRFIIIPVGIELKNGSHANYLIYDKKYNELERFEPYGSTSPYKFNYNDKLFDEVLSFKFMEIDNNIKYISPKDYLPKIGFQYFESFEINNKNIGDPGGFCAVWSIWYTDMRLIYPDVPRDKLVKMLMNELKKKNISFREMIRNYAYNATKIRDEIFNKVNISINDWINDQYTPDQYKMIIEEITVLLSSHAK